MEEMLKILLDNPDTLSATIKKYIDKYKPMVYDIAGEVLNVYKDFSDNKEYPATVAKVRKNMYDAYIDAGFTEEQALALMLNDNLQLMKNMEKINSSASKSK